MKQIYILRHAERDMTGSLTERGRQDATDLAKKLQKFDLVFASPVERTMETANILAHGVNVESTEEVGIYAEAKDLERLVDRVMIELPKGGRALIISHDTVIAPAMREVYGIAIDSLPPLTGCSISEDGMAKLLAV